MQPKRHLQQISDGKHDHSFPEMTLDFRNNQLKKTIKQNKQTRKQSINPLSDQSINQSINQSVTQSISQSIKNKQTIKQTNKLQPKRDLQQMPGGKHDHSFLVSLNLIFKILDQH